MSATFIDRPARVSSAEHWNCHGRGLRLRKDSTRKHTVIHMGHLSSLSTDYRIQMRSHKHGKYAACPPLLSTVTPAEQPIHIGHGLECKNQYSSRSANDISIARRHLTWRATSM